MGIINSAAAASVAGSICFGAAVNSRDVDGIADGWNRNTSVAAAGVEQRSRYMPMFQKTHSYIRPPQNAGDPSKRLETDAERISKPWAWGSSGQKT